MWLLANLAFDEGDADEVARLCANVIAQDDSAVNTRLLWAQSEIRRGEWAVALRLRLEAIVRAEARGDDVSGPRWDALVPATVLGDWPVVRDLAAALGMEMASTDGPIDEGWSQIRVRFEEDDGTQRTVSCLRTGPVSAVVRTIAHPDSPQHTNDRLVYDPTALEPFPSDEEERQSYQPLFAAAHFTERGGYRSFEFDGGYPGDDAWCGLMTAVEDAGFRTWLYSGEDYKIDGPNDEIEAIYGMLAIPAGADPVEAHRILTEATKDWDVPFVWTRLAHAAGADLTAQLASVEAYSIDTWLPEDILHP
jgi:hypothetical protein